MPPKKKTPATEGGEAEGGGAFRWTLENANKLFILTQGRYLTGEDYERLVSVFPGTNLNGVKIKVSRFRVEQRKLFDEYGWTLPEGGAVLKKGGGASAASTPRKTPTTKKRTAEILDADDAVDAEGEEMGTPSKKPKTTRKPQGKATTKGKGKKSDELIREESVEEDDGGVDVGDGGNGGGHGIKEEDVDEELGDMV